MDNEVGMIGLSFPGITQLYMAQTNPPSLAAISPMSIIEDTYRGTLYPGRHPQQRLRHGVVRTGRRQRPRRPRTAATNGSAR